MGKLIASELAICSAAACRELAWLWVVSRSFQRCESSVVSSERRVFGRKLREWCSEGSGGSIRRMCEGFGVSGCEWEFGRGRGRGREGGSRAGVEQRWRLKIAKDSRFWFMCILCWGGARSWILGAGRGASASFMLGLWIPSEL